MTCAKCKSRRADRERQRLARENRVFQRLKSKVIHKAPDVGRKNKLLVLQLAIQHIKDLLKQLGPDATIPQVSFPLRGSYESDEDGIRVKPRKKKSYHIKNGKRVYADEVKKYENCECTSSSSSSSSDCSPQCPQYQEDHHRDGYKDDDEDDDYQPQRLQKRQRIEETTIEYYYRA